MTFTDDDLKRLKGLIEMNIASHITIKGNKIPALLARLEAAEALCNHDTDDCEEENNGCHRCKLTKAWRKSKGA